MLIRLMIHVKITSAYKLTVLVRALSLPPSFTQPTLIHASRYNKSSTPRFQVGQLPPHQRFCSPVHTPLTAMSTEISSTSFNLRAPGRQSPGPHGLLPPRMHLMHHDTQ